MPTPVSAIDPNLVPVIGYGLTFVSSLVVGVFMGTHLQKRKETHELKLKEMDIQQKRDEMTYADLKDFRSRKALAGEELINGFTVYLQELEARKKYYQHLLDKPGDPETYARKAQQYENDIARHKDAIIKNGGGVLSKYFLFFADAKHENVKGKPVQAAIGETEDEEERAEALRLRFVQINRHTQHLYRSLLEGMINTPERHTGFRATAADLAAEKDTVLTELIALMQVIIDSTRMTIFQIREDISGNNR